MTLNKVNLYKNITGNDSKVDYFLAPTYFGARYSLHNILQILNLLGNMDIYEKLRMLSLIEVDDNIFKIVDTWEVNLGYKYRKKL